jgi:ribosomal protein S18 acetylase RimI-like enzyme
MSSTAGMINDSPNPRQLRKLNILRDLPAVADLIEKCFEDTMDAEGRRYVRDMRRAGSDRSFLRWASRAIETASLPLTGFVWEDNGEIIGNVSTIPFYKRHKKVFLIANVAVKPEFRRRGIGRILTISAIHYALQRQAIEIWLHVRDDNPGAVTLYQNLGFVTQAQRTTWHALPDRNTPFSIPSGYELGHSRQGWNQLETWYKTLYPETLSWYQPLPWRSIRPGIGSAIYRFFLEYDIHFWSVKNRGKTQGALLSESLSGDNGKLWVAVPSERGEVPLTSLLTNARKKLSWCQNLVIDFPAGVYDSILEKTGFQPVRSLLWMKLEGNKYVI